MISEPMNFFINNDPDGNLTAGGTGWTFAPGQKAPHAAGGGVSMQWAADPTDPTLPGFYYTVTGGSSVGFARSRDLVTWDPYVHAVLDPHASRSPSVSLSRALFVLPAVLAWHGHTCCACTAVGSVQLYYTARPASARWSLAVG